jgi:short-subunit dehydrogenase
MDQKGKTALVTGASSGIGLEIAKLHASRGGDLVLVARRKELLDSIKKDIEDKHKVIVQIIVKDLSAPNASEEVYNEVKVPIDYLINNAGFGSIGFFDETPLKTSHDMINLNVKSYVELTHFFLKDMVARKSGKILNVSSIAAFMPGPLSAIYFATKGFELSFSQALANEVGDKNITVSALCPGPVRTGFQRAAGFKRKETRAPGVEFASADEVAQLGYEGMLKGKVIIISGLRMKMQVFFLRFLPRSLVVKITRKIMALVA